MVVVVVVILVVVVVVEEVGFASVVVFLDVVVVLEIAVDWLSSVDLLVAGSFSNRRAYIQGLARVGRYNEPCSRYRLAGIQMINKEKENELYIKLSKLSSMQK